MNALFLYQSDGRPLDRDAIVVCLQNLDALTEFQMDPDPFALCTGRFEFEGESNLVELKKSLEIVILGREGRAALRLAFEIQQAYPTFLTVTNESYTVEFGVHGFESFPEFEKKFLKALEGA